MTRRRGAFASPRGRGVVARGRSGTLEIVAAPKPHHNTTQRTATKHNTPPRNTAQRAFGGVPKRGITWHCKSWYGIAWHGLANCGILRHVVLWPCEPMLTKLFTRNKQLNGNTPYLAHTHTQTARARMLARAKSRAPSLAKVTTHKRIGWRSRRSVGPPSGAKILDRQPTRSTSVRPFDYQSRNRQNVYCTTSESE